MSNKVEYRDLGRMSYAECWRLQQSLFDSIIESKRGCNEGGATNSGCGYILSVEHPAVYTLGKSGNQSNILFSEEGLQAIGAEYYHIDRGGDITFHGLGQIVLYPILDLERLGIGLKGYIEALEESVIETVAHYGIEATRVEGAAGVWVTAGGSPRKICAIGVKSSRYVTMHGLALNVSTDLKYFDYINPCGFTTYGVTSLEVESSVSHPLEEVAQLLVKNLTTILNVKIYKK